MFNLLFLGYVVIDAKGHVCSTDRHTGLLLRISSYRIYRSGGGCGGTPGATLPTFMGVKGYESFRLFSWIGGFQETVRQILGRFELNEVTKMDYIN